MSDHADFDQHGRQSGFDQPYGYPSAQGHPPYVRQSPTPRGTNVLAIIALIMAFVFAPAAIPCGVIARRQIRETGEEGHALATAGMWIGIVMTGFVVLILVFIFAIWLMILTMMPPVPAG